MAQRCLWEMDSAVAFTEATAYQDRNEHDLLRDFEQEVPGYLHNGRICESLSRLRLKPGREPEVVCDNLRNCYVELINLNVIPEAELPLVDAWIADILNILK